MELIKTTQTCKFITSDGKEFDNEQLAIAHDKKVCRQDYYDKLLSKRNFFQRLFNIKPNMDFFDRMVL